nr:reverse transcriptase domain-containing protein [Tanacetum cinerariifolium]
MSTRSSARYLFPPLDNPELTTQRRSRADPTLLNDFEMAAPVPDLQTMESIKVNGVTGDALHLYLFPHSLTHYATAWFDRLPRNSINTFEQMAKMFLGKYFPPSMVMKLRNEITNFRGTFMKRRPEECYDLVENMTAHHNDWDTSAQQSESSSSITSSSDTKIAALKTEMEEINKNLMRVLQVNQQVKAVTANCKTYGGPHSYTDCPATVSQTQNIYAAGACQGGSRTLPGNIITNPKEDLKGITTRSGTAYQGPTIPITSSSLPKVVEHETDVTKDTVPPTNNGSTKDVQPPVVQTETLILNSKPVVAPIIKPVAAPVSAPNPNQKPSISDFLLEDIDAFLAHEDEPTLPKVDHSYVDTEGDILLLEAFLNNDLSLPPPNQGNYLPQVRKELKIYEAKTNQSSIDEPPENELIPTQLVTGWRVCIDYRKFNEATRKDHFPLLFIDQMLERLAGNKYYSFLDGFSGYFQIPIDLKDQEKTTFTCPYETLSYRRMPFGLWNASGTFQRCMMAIFHDMIEKTMEVFMDDFSENSNFMVKEGIILGHKISKNGIEVDKVKVDVIAKLHHPTTIKAWLMTRLLEKDTPFFFSKECVEAFQTLRRKLTEAPILNAPDWDLPFELMCDASDFAIGAVLWQRQEKHLGLYTMLEKQ